MICTQKSYKVKAWIASSQKALLATTRNFRIMQQRLPGVLYVDIYFPQHQLVIEVDGPIHKTKLLKDDFKEKLLKKIDPNIKIARITYQDKPYIEKLAKVLAKHGVSTSSKLSNAKLNPDAKPFIPKAAITLFPKATESKKTGDIQLGDSACSQ